MSSPSSQGFSFVEGILVIAAVALLGTVGYLGYTNLVANDTSSTDQSSQNVRELDTAQNSLNDTDLDDDFKSLDEELAF